MPTVDSYVFPWERTKAYCRKLGLPFDTDFAERVEVFCRVHSIGAETADAAGQMYAGRMWQAFNPRSYSRWGRVKLAWHFLFGRMEGA